MIQNKRFIQFCRITFFMLALGLIASGLSVQIANAGISGITPTPTQDTTLPTSTPVTPEPTPIPPTAEPTEPPTTNPVTSTPVPTSPSNGSSNPNPDPTPTPTPNFPSEIPELGYGPSIWLSLSILLILTSILGVIATFVIRRISA